MESIVRGEALMLFLNGESIAHATNHTLSKTLNMNEISTKDYGKFSAQSPQRITWQITADNMYTNKGWKTMSDLQNNMTPVVAYFGYADDNDNLTGLGDRSYFTLDETASFSYGEVYVQDLNCTAQSGSEATFSCTLVGNGPLTEVVGA